MPEKVVRLPLTSHSSRLPTAQLPSLPLDTQFSPLRSHLLVLIGHPSDQNNLLRPLWIKPRDPTLRGGRPTTTQDFLTRCREEGGDLDDCGRRRDERRRRDDGRNERYLCPTDDLFTDCLLILTLHELLIYVVRSSLDVSLRSSCAFDSSQGPKRVEAHFPLSMSSTSMFSFQNQLRCFFYPSILRTAKNFSCSTPSTLTLILLEGPLSSSTKNGQRRLGSRELAVPPSSPSNQHPPPQLNSTKMPSATSLEDEVLDVASGLELDAQT